MFYLIDVIQNICVAICNTRNDLLLAWCKYANSIRKYDYLTREESRKLSFSELSMNNNDCNIHMRSVCTGKGVDGLNGYDMFYDRIPRRFRVLDEYGRTIDIREWPEVDKPLEWPKYESKWSHYNFGHKNHRHRMRSAAMRKQMLQDPIIEADDIPDNVHKLDVKIRKRTQLTGWDEEYWYDNKSSNKWSQTNWKDNCKARHQWGKHKKKSEYDSIRHMKPLREFTEWYNPLDDIDWDDTEDMTWYPPEKNYDDDMSDTFWDDYTPQYFDQMLDIKPEPSSVVILTPELTKSVS